MIDKTKIQQIQHWIKHGIDKNAIEEASRYGKELAAPGNDPKIGLTTSQIRNVFGELRRIQMNGYEKLKTDFLLTKPKLAYAAKRHNKMGVKLFYQLYTAAYDAVNVDNDQEGKKHFENLMQFMEAVLAYHKYYGGKE
jgi:CRISPR-associated protein Csm2